jgi:TPR repeat protein
MSDTNARIDDEITFTEAEMLLDNIAALTHPGKLPCDDPQLATTIHGWREHDPAEGEAWLRRSAEEGDVYAMQKLGQRLIEGDGLEPSPEEGMQWLKKSAEHGNPLAMTDLANIYFDMSNGTNTHEEGLMWLNRAIEHGDKFAAVAYGVRLLVGRGVEQNSAEGERLLREAAENDGILLAHIRLGAHLIGGWGLPRDRRAGLLWLRRVGATSPPQITRLGTYLSNKSLAARRTDAMLLREEAAILCEEGVRQGVLPGQMIIAYLIRRGEIDATSRPSLDELLSEHVKKDQPFALVNQALRLARGVQCEVDWAKADEVFSRIPTSEEIFDWWYARARDCDPEGDIVVAWLARYGLIVDPDGMDVAERFKRGSRGGWEPPDWILQRKA